jgi:hypothetical protein
VLQLAWDEFDVARELHIIRDEPDVARELQNIWSEFDVARVLHIIRDELDVARELHRMLFIHLLYPVSYNLHGMSSM